MDGLGRLTTLEATTVVVEGDLGTPVMVASRFANTIQCSHAGESTFPAFLAAHGIDRTVLVDHIPSPDADEVDFNDRGYR